MAPISYHLTPFRPRLRGSEMGPSQGRQKRAVWDAESRGSSLTETRAPSRQNRRPTPQSRSHRSWKMARLLWAVPVGVFWLVDQGLVPKRDSGCLRLLTFPRSSEPGHLVPRCPSWLSSSPPPPFPGTGQRSALSSRLALCCGHVTFSPGFISEPQATPFKGSEELIRAVCLSR